MRMAYVGLALMLVLGLGAILLWRLADHDLDCRVQRPFDFVANGLTVRGTLWQSDIPARVAVVLVHGDGPQDRSSAGGYAPLINALLDAGIAVASWDKPGIGASEGNWLNQSMADRTAETRAALDALRPQFEGKAIGAIGFSQAGWVLPDLTPADADFLVLSGPAVSWQHQGDYYTRMRLRAEGVPEPEIDRHIARIAAEDDLIFAPDATFSSAAMPDGMSGARWAFIRRNRHADARPALAELELPVLVLWGAEDLNVDATHDAAIYRQALSGRQADTDIAVIPQATHALLKSGPYNTQLASDWSAFAALRFLLEGRSAFAPGVLDRITGWILAQSS